MSATRQLKMMQNVSMVVARQMCRMKWYNTGVANETLVNSLVFGPVGSRCSDMRAHDAERWCVSMILHDLHVLHG